MSYLTLGPRRIWFHKTEPGTRSTKDVLKVSLVERYRSVYSTIADYGVLTGCYPYFPWWRPIDVFRFQNVHQSGIEALYDEVQDAENQYEHHLYQLKEALLELSQSGAGFGDVSLDALHVEVRDKLLQSFQDYEDNKPETEDTYFEPEWMAKDTGNHHMHNALLNYEVLEAWVTEQGIHYARNHSDLNYCQPKALHTWQWPKNLSQTRNHLVGIPIGLIAKCKLAYWAGLVGEGLVVYNLFHQQLRFEQEEAIAISLIVITISTALNIGLQGIVLRWIQQRQRYSEKKLTRIITIALGLGLLASFCMGVLNVDWIEGKTLMGLVKEDYQSKDVLAAYLKPTTLKYLVKIGAFGFLGVGMMLQTAFISACLHWFKKVKQQEKAAKRHLQQLAHQQTHHENARRKIPRAIALGFRIQRRLGEIHALERLIAKTPKWTDL